MMKIKYLILLLVIFCSCSVRDKINLEQINSARITQINQSGINAEVGVTITNETSLNIKVLSADFEIVRGGEKLADATIVEQFSVAKLSTEEYLLPLRLTVGKDFFAKIPAMLSNSAPVTIQGTIIARVGIFKKLIVVSQSITAETLRGLMPAIGF